MKYILSFVLLIFSSISFAQQIFTSLELENSEPKEAQFIFVYGEPKELNDDIESYLLRFGKTSNSENSHAVSLNQTFGESESVSKIVCNLIEIKPYSKLAFFFLDQNSEAVTGDELQQEDVEAFIYGLYDLIRTNAEKRQVTQDLEISENNVEGAEKDKGKIEKNIERNLREQEKLGKRLDASPEDLSKLIEEKNTVLQAKLSGDIEDGEESDVEELDKKISKTEKAIVKRKKKEERDAKKLNQKEDQLKELSKELFAAQEKLKNLETVLEDKKRLMKVLNL